MLLLTTDAVPGREIAAALGLVRGSTVRTRHVGADVLAGLRGVIGGEVAQYARLLEGAREQALGRMIDAAQEIGADAVVAVRFETSTIRDGASEVIAYGTAIRLR